MTFSKFVLLQYVNIASALFKMSTEKPIMPIRYSEECEKEMN